MSPMQATSRTLGLYALVCGLMAVGQWNDDTLWLGRVWAVFLGAACIANMVLLAGGRASWVEPAGTLAGGAFAARGIGVCIQLVNGSWERGWATAMWVIPFWFLVANVTAWIVYPAIAVVRAGIGKGDG